ncbi:MAG: hypothetical protein ACFFCH_05175 [Promethearchaeota archaeon]
MTKDLYEAIATHRIVRKFKNAPVGFEKLHRVLNAGPSKHLIMKLCGETATLAGWGFST